MDGFILLDAQKLLNGELCVGKSGGSEVTFFELGKGLRIKLGFKLFQNIRKLCGKMIGLVNSVRVGCRYDQKTQNRDETGTEPKTKTQRKGHLRRTSRFVAALLFHGAAATKRGAARAMIDVKKRIVFINGNDREKGLRCWRLWFKRKEGLL